MIALACIFLYSMALWQLYSSIDAFGIDVKVTPLGATCGISFNLLQALAIFALWRSEPSFTGAIFLAVVCWAFLLVQTIDGLRQINKGYWLYTHKRGVIEALSMVSYIVAISFLTFA